MTARTPGSLYEEDFYAWTQLQARALRRIAENRPNLQRDLASADAAGRRGRDSG